MGVFKYLLKAWRTGGMNKELKRERLIQWRREPVTLRIERPTRIDRARSLGYRAKPGMFVVRQRVARTAHRRPKVVKGRTTKRQGVSMDLRKNYQWIAQERAGRAFKNCEVLNSYWVAEDGKYYWFEVIMVDRSHPQTKADGRTSWISQAKGRAQRGLTSAARKTRGLRHKGKGVEKARPSRRSHSRLQ